MNKKHIILSFAIVSSFTYSCTKDEVVEDSVEECSTPYTFDADIASIITDKCTNCHAPGGQSPILTNYAEVVENINTFKIEVVVDKTMPLGSPLSDEEIQKISCWIDQGLLEK